SIMPIGTALRHKRCLRPYCRRRGAIRPDAGYGVRMSLTRRTLALSLAATPLAAPALAQAALPPADKALVDRAIAYLEGLTEARGRFVQTDARGRASTGQLFLKRPGKARFA